MATITGKPYFNASGLSYVRQPHLARAHFMKTAAEYRAMADECFKWAREAQTKEVRKSYLQLAQIWLNTASKIDGLPPTQSPLAPDEATKRMRSAGEG
jgi:hypothetical protein